MFHAPCSLSNSSKKHVANSLKWDSTQPLRPVVVVFYGGAFIEGTAYFTIPPAGYPVLNVSSSNNFLFIYPNYRVNAFGFLPGAEIASSPTSDLNPGLLDQDAALRWAHKYASHFGGDPGNVSIWGQSAGAGSVVAQVIANSGRTSPPLFTRALASSPFWPKTYKYDAPEAQDIYNSLVNLTGCGGTGQDSLKCLKSVDVQTIREASLQISGSETYERSSYTWAPVIDGRFLTQSLSEATRKGEVNIDVGWGMYNTHEGMSSFQSFTRMVLTSTKERTSSPLGWRARVISAVHLSIPALLHSTPGSGASCQDSQTATSRV
jgi:carboxylesterase type B